MIFGEHSSASAEGRGQKEKQFTSQLYWLSKMTVLVGLVCDAMLAFFSADASSELS